MIVPFFLDTPEGALHVSLHMPPDARPASGWVVHVPAFAEEMNKSRAMVSRQARALAARGYAVVVPDLYGTGDSAGELREATWALWQRNVEAVLDWVGEHGAGGVCLWGLRTGCLLALQVARARHRQVARLVLWQPVLAGRQFLTQFLRLRMAAGLSDGRGETTAILRERLDSGETLEVAGYELAPGLASQLEQVSAQDLPPPADLAVVWLELAGRADQPLSPAAQRVLQAWAEVGVAVHPRTAVGDAFWATQEIALAPALLESTVRALEEMRPAAVPHGPGPGAAGGPPVAPVSVAGSAPGAELPLVFRCAGEELAGVLHRGAPAASTGVVLVVGGPQYRVGSHRQFVYLARALAAQGVPVLRFDYRGMGDSAGAFAGFLSAGPDIASAIDALQHRCPQVSRVVLWGLCDAATAAACYAPNDQRVGGLVLLNPWVHSARGQARAYLRHYYLRRAFEAALWRKVLRGEFDLAGAVGSLVSNLRQLFARGRGAGRAAPAAGAPAAGCSAPEDLAARLFEGLARFPYPVLLILSGRDLTAAQFSDAVDASRPWRRLLAHRRFTRHRLDAADHTFARRAWRDQVAQWSARWLQQL
ncbi:MAG: hydrolase 1, exosortase A system-associated [Halioglobus sp.]|nr:hydrolase 1, exosortase A system-associated [Halioglobus sp.]